MKKSTMLFSSAAVSALVLTGGITAVANAVSVPQQPAPLSLPAVDVPAAPNTTVQQNRISVGASADAVKAALAKCQADNLPFVTVALVDRFGTVQALLRGDNAAEHTIEAAKQKAYTAAAFGAPTSELAGRISGNGKPSIADLPGTLYLPGGVPLKVNGVSVAGIGVGGAPDGMLDEACATAGADAIVAAGQ
ncbi:heme-binding protein [Pseudarthrobacter sp. J75]|uniref:GlcG/HbpS family heme-binding protein n=1 Tax=unclassified Pseudarthrobacter TaxID=2647000 RepID=UPI002E7FE92E|nr:MULTISPECIES: heme-binding protein [unclassified Pseudarthrobacter]MEE2523478.1 heme-binding protein [Pseudarthrobacter sp. J47]MEE2530453.1 heme-binding protein [Pseudarthrobacter sp. J75]MEE2570165.1 heme-binding protein [Pseudarthrobacter sp. J64]